MKIENIKRLNSGKYKLTFDNDDKMITYDDVILKNGLLFKREIDKKMLDKLVSDNYYQDIYSKIIKYINVRLRSKKEIYDYLDKFQLDNNLKEEIINNLENVGLINDKFFIKAYINDKIYLSSSGPYKIVEELRNHNIDESIILDEIEKIDKQVIIEKLSKIIEKKIKSNGKYSKYMLKQKLSVELTNNGYEKDMIFDLYDKLATQTDDILQNTYEKIYNQLSRKYNGYELFNKIKQKLYQKGFDINEINQLLSNKIDN